MFLTIKIICLASYLISLMVNGPLNAGRACTVTLGSRNIKMVQSMYHVVCPECIYCV